MPGGARVHSLRDLDLLHDGGPQKPTGRVPPMKVCHIPTLPEADAALRMLNRIHREFYPIVERRGYHVLSLSELCCCGDGLDHDKGRRRKLKKMNDNILGYNATHSNGTHTIHLRLRDARNHSVMLSYEEVAGCMSHELAHCVHGPHDAKFYKLMDEIQEQHAVFMARGIVADQQGFPMDSRQAYTLGGGNSGGNGRGQAAAAAAARRERSKWMPQGPQKLGGDAGFRKWLGPGEAAGQAAEARRLRDEVWCQPCGEVLELSDSEEEEVEDTKPAAVVSDSNTTDSTTNDSKPTARVRPDDSKPAARARPNKSDTTTTRSASVVTIDLTGSDDEIEISVGPSNASQEPKRRRLDQQNVDSAVARALENEDSWPCSKCTFINPSMSLACNVCRQPRNSLDRTMKVVDELRKKDVIENVKENEVKQSEEQFGFNIYGKASQATGKLKHIT